MNVPHGYPVDPNLVAHVARQLDVLGGRMGEAGRDLAVLRDQLARAQQGVPAFPQPVPAPTNHIPPPVQPLPAHPGPRQTPTQPVASPRTPWWQRDGAISRVLAVAGVAVTLVGVVMLLVLAAQAGFFGPVPRVVLGAALSVGLVFAGHRVHGRAGGRVGGTALAATGTAGAYLDVVAVTTVYGWLPPVLGMIVALGIAAAGVGLAVTWNSQPFAVLVVLGGALLAPFVTGGLTVGLIGFLFVVQVAPFAAQLGRDWKYLSVSRTVPVVLALLIADFTVRPSDHGTAMWAAAAAFAVCAFGLASSIVLLRRNPSDTTAVVLIAVAALPTIFVGELFSRTTSVVVAGIVSAVMFGTSVLTRGLVDRARVVIAGIGALELLVFCVLWSTAALAPLVVTGVGALFFVVAGQARSRIAFGVGVAFTVVGAILHANTATIDTLVDRSRAVDDLGLPIVLSGTVLVAAVVLLVQQAHRLVVVRPQNARTMWLISGIAVLYAGTSAIVAAGTALTGDDAGFIGGHCAATIVWMLAATVALRFGLDRHAHARIALGVGLTLTAAAVAKLFLFDLATLGGIARVLAFIVVGLLLLGAGTRYAREFAVREPVTDASDERSVR